MNPNAQTVILPRPVTLSTLGSFLTFSKAGIICPEASLRLTQQRPPEGTPVCLADNRIVNLLVHDVHDEAMQGLIKQATPALRRWINWLHFGGDIQHDTLAYAIAQMQKQNWKHGQVIVQQFMKWIEANSQIDPLGTTTSWRSELETLLVENESDQILILGKLPDDKKFVHLPFFEERSGFTAITKSMTPSNPEPTSRKDPALPDSEVAGTLQVELVESNILQLIGGSIATGFGGLPNSGKSTLCVSVAAEMQAIIRSLQTRTGWPAFDITVGVVNLDLATPTAEAIARGHGQDREGLVAIKRKWSIGLAEEARVLLEEARKKYTIVLCDLPGGDPDDITRVIASGLDAGVIITRDWEKAMEKWPILFKSVGVKIVSRIRSRLPGEGFSSLATHRRVGERISGRVSGLFRNTKAWDRFVEYLALFLLFEILPNLYGKKLP